MIKNKPAGGALPIVRITGNYQMTIPAIIRKTLGVSVGDYVQITLNSEGLAILKPIEIVTKKTKKQDDEDIAWKKFGQEQFLKQYDEKDAAYDSIQL